MLATPMPTGPNYGDRYLIELKLLTSQFLSPQFKYRPTARPYPDTV
jgi:hypothetical protein